MINEIRSPYILKNIFNYIPDKNNLLKLFRHSKYFQNRLEINYLNCYNKYIQELGFYLNDYLHLEDECYEKGKLADKYNNFIRNLNKEKFEKILFEVINNLGNKIKTYIDIDSPLFEMISKAKNFDKKYRIYISQKIIDKYKLKDEYRIILNKINNLNSKKASICYISTDEAKLDYLKELNINTKNIRKINLKYQGDENELDKKDEDGKDEKDKCGEEAINEINTLSLFTNLEKLYILGYKNLNNILENADLKQLKKIGLNGNKISDINILEKVKFDKLELLGLGGNEISDINILEKLNLKNLKNLHLQNNRISDITVLGKVKFDKLEILELSHNKISDINVLKNVNFKQLKLLALSNNLISDISVLENVNFEELISIHLEYNMIFDITVLQKVKFDKLEILDLTNNEISDINVLENVNLKNLKYLYLVRNYISDIKVLEKVKLDKLEMINLNENEIDEDRFFSISTNPKFLISW